MATKILCKYLDCRFKSKENGYCGKHQRIFLFEKAKEEGKSLCNIKRGCFTELKIGEKYCEPCKEKRRVRENNITKKNAEEFIKTIEANPESSVSCRNCRVEFKVFMNSHNKESRVCLECLTKEREREKTRVRNRNYQEESAKHLETYWKSFCSHSKKRNIDVNISETEFLEMIKKSCYYCDYSNEKEVLGIDRLDSTKGYLLENCVTACKLCNRMKHIYHPEFFIEKAKWIINHELNEFSKKEIEDFYQIWKEYIPGKAISYGAFVTYAKVKREIDVLFSREEYNEFVKQKCYLCGFQNPKGIGIDRVDSLKRVYSAETCKPCCGSCNMMKAIFGLDIFKSQLIKIACHHTITPKFPNIIKQKFLMGAAKGKHDTFPNP